MKPMTVDGFIVWAVLSRFIVPPNILAGIREFHDGKRGCVPLDDVEISSMWSSVFGKGVDSLHC